MRPCTGAHAECDEGVGPDHAAEEGRHTWAGVVGKGLCRKRQPRARERAFHVGEAQASLNLFKPQWNWTLAGKQQRHVREGPSEVGFNPISSGRWREGMVQGDWNAETQFAPPQPPPPVPSQV